jgi:hypothetical protein
MSRNDLLKLSVTLVLLVATALVSVTAVAADPWYPVKAGDAAAASDWFERHTDTGISAGAADLSDYFQRHPDTSIPAETVTGVLAPLDWYLAHDHAVLDGDNNVVSSGKNLMDNRLAPLDWYFAHDHAVLDGDNNVVSNGKELSY